MDNTLQTKRDGIAKRLLWIIGIVFVLVVILVVALAGLMNGISGKDASASLTNASPTPTATATPTPTPTAANCAPEFTQVTVDRQGTAKVNPNFGAEVNAAIASGVEDPLRATALVDAGHSGLSLSIYAHQVGLLGDDQTTWPSYVEGNCLSQEGQRMYDKLDGAYHLQGVTFAVGEAPATGNNSGVDTNGTYGVDASSGIGGDRKAIEITLPDGSKTWIMFRCGNPVFMGRPNLPTVPTDNPPPATTPPVVPPSDAKVWTDSVKKPSGVTPIPGAVIEPRPPAAANPAPVVPEATVPESTSQAPGATVPDPVRNIPAPATGTTPDGGTGSVNPAPVPGSTTPPVNTGDPGNPF